MHSSRMRTVRSSIRLLEGCLLLGGGVCSWECLLLGGVCSWGVSAPGGLLLGVSAPGGWWWCIPWSTETDPPPSCEQNDDRCKSITFATSLWTVLKCCNYEYTALYWSQTRSWLVWISHKMHLFEMKILLSKNIWLHLNILIHILVWSLPLT